MSINNQSIFLSLAVPSSSPFLLIAAPLTSSLNFYGETKATIGGSFWAIWLQTLSHSAYCIDYLVVRCSTYFHILCFLVQ